MRCFYTASFILFTSFFSYSQEIKKPADETAFWKDVAGEMKEFKKVFKKYKKYRLEIIYTEIDRKEDYSPVFTSYHFGDKDQYFYPASTVKLPMAIFALEKIHNQMEGVNIEYLLQFDSTAFCNGHQYKNHFHTWYRVGKNETLEYLSKKLHRPESLLVELNPQLKENSVPEENSLLRISVSPALLSFRELLTEMLVFSANEPFNKLFEFTTPEYLNMRLYELGFLNSVITRRLMYCNDDWRKKSQVFSLHKNDSVFHSVEHTRHWYDSYSVAKEGMKVGKKYVNNEDKVIKGPRDFTGHNSLSLEDLNTMLLRLVFMENLDAKKKFGFTRFEQRTILRLLGTHPLEIERLRDKAYENSNNGASNFILYGGASESPDPDIRIVNIVGQAYGFSTDCAYVMDAKNKTEFMLAVRIYTNKNQVLGDDKYEYKEIAMPFMKKLGEIILEKERKRKREVVPNLNYWLSLFK